MGIFDENTKKEVDNEAEYNEEDVTDDEVIEIIDDIAESSNEDSEDDLIEDKTASEDSFVSNDAVRDYMKSIAQYSRNLEDNEVIELSKAIQDGIKAAETLDAIGNIDQSNEEMTKTLIELQDIMQKGEMARQKLTNHNLRFVITVAKKYRNCKCDLLDLIQEGNIGLMKATTKYDYQKGYKFNTYSEWWIRQAITRYIMNTSNAIRIPVHTMEKVLKIKKVRDQLLQEKGHEPSTEEIAKIVNMPVKKVDELLIVLVEPISMDSPLNSGDGGNDTYISDFIKDENIKSPEDSMFSSELKKEIFDILSSKDFKDRDREIIIRRYGLDGSGTMTFEELGEYYHLSRQRIQQIEEKILGKLRKDKNKRRIEAYLH